MRIDNQIKVKLAVATVILIILFTIWRNLDAGFCVSRFQILEDKELIRSAIRLKFDDKADNFFRANPNCCSLTRHPMNRNLLDVFTGFNISEVEINYQRLSLDASAEPFYKSFVAVHACGEAIREAYGTSTPTLEHPQ